MPHEAILNASSSFRTSQIVLGDRYGATCAPEIINDLIKLISKNGLRASRNIPFSGAYIVQKYGSPGLNRHAIQLEIDRSIYMDERKIQKLENFTNLRTSCKISCEIFHKSILFKFNCCRVIYLKLLPLIIALPPNFLRI